MAITAEMVKELRERTGAGMMDCKRALTEVNGDMDKAIEFLREKGLASAAKKAGRIASEGLVVGYVTPDGTAASLVEVNCETDFVAKTDEFVTFAADVARHVAEVEQAEAIGEGAQLLGQAFLADKSVTLQEALTAKIAKIGENMALRRFAKFSLSGPGRLEVYIHMGGRIGVLVEFACDETAAKDAGVKTAARDVALQIAAARPEYVSRTDVPTSAVESETAIYKAQAANEGKPAQVQEKIAQGKLEKYFKEICLLEQPFVKDPDKSVQAMLNEVAKAAGGTVTLKRFARFERGEGLAKREDNFAAEVMGQANK